MYSVLSFFVNDAWGQGSGGGAGQTSALGFNFLFLIAIFAAFWFLIFRPQQKKQKEHRQMVDALSSGDEVVTGGGVLGKVTEVGEQFVTVEIANNVKIKIQKHTITAVLPKGTVKSA